MFYSLRNIMAKVLVMVFITAITAGLWVEALHHHNDFQSHPECPLFHATSSPASFVLVEISFNPVYQIINYEDLVCSLSGYLSDPLSYSSSHDPPRV
ncbi:MAG: hypothetical protein JXR95_06795 [Deltaproteobacteria bacterium]|nr:hypothetical protein [Deltaproteobacteria bacterium]